MAWTDLTPAQQAAWKRRNFNSKVNVPKSAIDKLMAGKTKANNIKKYSGTASPVMREAMNRFYGKGWDKGGSGTKPESPGKPGEPTKPTKPQSNERGGGRFAPDKAAIPSQSGKGGGKGRQTPVTSVTPKITVKAVGKKQQAATRNMVLGLATLTGVGGVARLAGTAGLKAVGARVGSRVAAGANAARITGNTGAQQSAQLLKRVETIKSQLAKGALAKSEAQKLIIDANLKFNRNNTLRVAQGQSGVVQGIAKTAVQKALAPTAKATTKATVKRAKKSGL